MARSLALALLVTTGLAFGIAAQSAAPSIVGKWKVSGPPDGGDWFVVLNADGTSAVLNGNETRVNGRYTAKDGQFTVTDVSGAIACLAEDTKTGTYKYALDGKQLKLEAIKDDCEGRRMALTAKPLQPAP